MQHLTKTVETSLTKEEQHEVVKQLAEFREIEEVRGFVKSEYGKELSYNAIKFYLKAKKWKSMLERFRAEYVEPIMSLPVSHKFIRLVRYENLYETDSSNGNTRGCRETLRAVREEIEGPKSNQSGSLFITQINKLSDEDLNRKKTEILDSIRKIGNIENIENVENVGDIDVKPTG